MKKIYFLVVLLVLTLTTAKSQTDYTIGSATGTNTGTTYPSPLQDFYEGSRSQYLYTASELQAAGMGAGLILSLKFNVTNLNNFSGTIPQYTISIGGTSTLSLDAAVWESGTTAVYGPVDYVPALGINEFVFSAPYLWNGTDNIIIEICNGFPGNNTILDYTENVSTAWTTGLTFNGSHTYRADNLGNLCSTTTLTNSGTQTTRPDAIFSWNSSTACSGSPTAGAAVSSKDTTCPNQGFNLYTTGSSLGSGLTYQWESSSDGVNYSAISGATGFSYNVAGGIAINGYYRRIVTCTASGTATTSTPVLVHVRPFYECYCSYNTNTTLHTASTLTIEKVDINGGGVTYSNSNAGSNAAPTLGYASFTDTTGVNNPAIPVLKQAGSYTLSLSTSANPGGAGVWIDWNHNQLFDSAEYQIIKFDVGTSVTDLALEIPANAPLGLTMMRIRIRNVAFTYNASCTTFGNGETEDYIFKVIAGSACSGTPAGGTGASSVAAICPNKPFSLSIASATSGVTNLTYQWQDSSAAHTWQDIVGETNKTCNIPGITIATCYRRMIVCNGGVSSLSTTACVEINQIINCYCSPLNGTVLHTSTATTNIENVAISGGAVAYTNSNPGANVAPSLGYTAFTDTTLAPVLSQAVPYTLTVTTSATPTQAAVWIDWDKSGTFDPSEMQIITFATGATTADVNITPSATTPLGFTAMRIRVRAAAFTLACEQFGSGETEDYVIKIVPGSTCTGSPMGGTTNVSTTTACSGIPMTLSVIGATDGVIGLTYQWQDSIPGGTWQNISGATALTYTTTQTVISKCYRRKIICTTSSASNFSIPTCVTQNVVTYASIPFSEDFENTWEDGCGDANSRTIPNNSWRNSPLMSDSSWRRNDDAAAAGWGNPNSGPYSPASSTGTYSARFHSYQAAARSSGNLDLYVNCSVGSSLKRLSFDFINTSGNDSVQIFLSTDGGTNFTKMDTFKLASVWTNRIIDFTSSSATTVIRFRATSDFGVTDIGIDNLSIINLTAVDIAATSLVLPTGSFTLTNAGTITVAVQNVGAAIINFATDSLTVGAWVVNPLGAATKYSKTIKTGTIAIGATQDIIITSAANFSDIGTYSIKSGVGITADPNILNDSLAKTNFTTTSVVFNAVANGNWGDGSTWSTGTVPTTSDTVNITGFNVALAGATASPYTCSSLGIGDGGTLSAATNVLNIGAINGSNKAFTLSKGATLNISGGTINHNGFLLIGDSSNFTMSGGNLNIDGNSGANVSSVPTGVDILGFGSAAKPFSFGTINLTGGTITIVDPHRFNGVALGYRGGIPININAANTIVMGTPTSTHTSISGTGGFVISTLLSSARMSLGNLTINGGNTIGNRFTSIGVNTGINGNLTVNANSELRSSLSPSLTGNLINNGLMAFSNSLNFQAYLNGTPSAVTTAQSISGSGIFRNNIPTITTIASGSGYAVGNVLTLSGGTSTTPARVYILAVGGSGSVANAVILDMGNYTVAPTGTLTTTGGAGTGATFTAANLISPSKFNNMFFNNTSAAGITINSLGTALASQTGTISGTLTMSAGIINNPNDIFIIGTSTAQRGTFTYTSGVFTGKLRRWFAAATNATITGDFPVGKTSFARNARIEFTTAPTKGGSLTTEFIATAPGLGGFPINDGISLVNIANDGYWRVDNDSITGGNYSISLTDSGITNVQTLATLRAVKRASGATNWSVDGAAGVNTGTITKPVVVRTGLSGFSEFAIAGASDNTLPYTSLEFVGTRIGNMNQLKWTVINEISVKGYELQRSTNAINFSTIATVLSKSNDVISPKLDYSYTDNNSIANNGYYRLKQTAKDGSINYSNIVLIKGLKISGLIVGNIYPNPAKSMLNVIVASESNRDITVMITSISGKQVIKTNSVVNQGDNRLQVNLGKLAAGNYTIIIADANGNKSNVVSFVKE